MEEPRKQLEFAVQMTCQSCVQSVERCLEGVQGIQAMKVNLDGESVLVDTTLTAEEVQNLLESTGRLAVLKGMGSTTQRDLGAAVAMVEGVNCIQGVVRFIQLSLEKCIIEGTIDGLNPGLHGLHVHTFGDLTDSFNKCGDHFNPEGKSHGDPKDSDRHMGDLGNILADETGRAVFRKEDNYLKETAYKMDRDTMGRGGYEAILYRKEREQGLPDHTQTVVQVWRKALPKSKDFWAGKVGDIIGRSIVVDEGEDDLGRGGNPLSKISGNSGER
ncbi:copper chaperone for superoxide dismutase isoform X2 [Pleurodeles waltl]